MNFVHRAISDAYYKACIKEDTINPLLKEVCKEVPILNKNNVARMLRIYGFPFRE